MDADDADRAAFISLYSSALRDFIRWKYDELLPDNKAAAMALGINHNSFLLILLKQQVLSAKKFGANLLEVADAHKVDRKVIHDLNAEVLRELLKIIASRLRSNPELAAEHGFIVTQMAHELWTIMKAA
jgi:hypothetical protein